VPFTTSVNEREKTKQKHTMQRVVYIASNGPKLLRFYLFSISSAEAEFVLFQLTNGDVRNDEGFISMQHFQCLIWWISDSLCVPDLSDSFWGN